MVLENDGDISEKEMVCRAGTYVYELSLELFMINQNICLRRALSVVLVGCNRQLPCASLRTQLLESAITSDWYNNAHH
jgi:hypothetical protein